ncbi:putative aarF domain-containing protein kinase 2 [Discoglossus pictus]
MAVVALHLRAGLTFRMCFQKRTWTFPRWRWSDVALRGQKHSLSAMRALPKVTLLCWGLNGIRTTALCERLSQEDPAMTMSRRSNVGSKQPPQGLLHQVTFILHLSLRAFVLFLKFGPLFILYPLTYLSTRFTSLWFHLLLKATETSGPACIKLGQWACTRRDLFSEEFCLMFSKLHVQVTPHNWDYTERCLKRAFGEDWRQVLSFPSCEPVGSGCVAQVYKAFADLSRFEKFETLVDSSDQDSGFEAWEVPGLAGILGRIRRRRQPENGTQEHVEDTTKILAAVSESPLSTEGSEMSHLIPVAVKVLHPGLSQQVRMDLLLMKTWSRLLGMIPGFKWLSLTEIVEEFEKLMSHQTDLRFEARNLEIFQQKFERVEFIKFPRPLRPFVTRNVLVETFEEGDPVSMYLKEPNTCPVKQRIARMGSDMLLKMVFVDNFVHADLHPGNILVQGVKEFSSGHVDQTTLVDMCDTLIVNVRPSRCPLRLVLLDAGIVAELQDGDLQNFRAVFTAVVLGQGERVAELILHHARASQCRDEDKFRAEMAELVTEAKKNTVSLGKVQVAVLLSRVFRLLMTHKVKLESNFASIMFAILVLEGLGRALDPDMDILEAAKPLLLKNATSLLT